MNKRTSYHTTLKELVHLGLLPHSYLKDIPRANISRWKHDIYERFKGSELNEIANNHSELIKTLNHFPRMFYAYGRLVHTLVSIAETTADFKQVMRESKNKIVNAIIRTQQLIPINKAVKLFNISKATFHTWVIDTKLQCTNSTFNLCNKIYSSQVIPKEIMAVKKALLNKSKLHWSIRSVHLHGIRNGYISVSENTMYKINKVLGIRKSVKYKKKKKYKKGIRATAPNRIWHTDITTLKTLDNKRYYIYLIIDNYSRKILSYAIQERVSGLITKSIIEEAYQKAIKVTKDLNIDLIVDGGTENNNIHVHNFIQQSSINIRKLIALKDINFSNSMIERVNRTFKSRYILPEHPKDLEHLIDIILFFINDYNNVRPHGVLGGLTPDEAYRGAIIDENFRTNALKKARIERLRYNKENKCNKCDKIM